jgi:diguanylate cyclase (GGDEF)-like protein
MDDSRSRSPVAPSVLSAAAFFAAAGAFAALAPSTRSFGLVDVFLLVSFAVLVRLEYQVGAGAAVPAQLAFVPMLFLMPLRVVPLAVGGVCLLTSALATATGNRPHFCPNAFGACWFALPPAVILLVAGERTFTWHDWPLYVAAFVAQCLVDLVQAAAYERYVNGARMRPLAEVLGTVYAFDALLTPIAMLAALEGGYSFLALLPFTGVLYLLGRERRSRLSAQSEADRLEELAHLDPLTQTPNRRDFDRRLATERTRAERSGESLSICLLDLDHFKRYNDSLGHPAGDDLLRRVAGAWTSTLRAQALLARIGGEEFGLILPGATLEAAEAIVERLRGVTPREITFSAGLAAWDHEETIAALTERADVALYRAKREGRDRFVLAA